MQLESDARLLRAYTERGVEAAFTELVHRHTNLVYSAAWRQVDSAETAAEIAQRVFIGLARGAHALLPRLAADASLAGWLCRSARNLSLNHRRDEFRRQTRERQAMEQLITFPENTPDWECLRGVLDDAMAELSETDYDALVLRFFQQQDFRAVGAALGVSDDTAQKRVARALETLRDHLSHRGISTTAAALALVISANAMQAAPAGLAAAISTAALLAGTAVSTSTLVATTATATKTIVMTTLQKTLIGVTVAVLAGAGINEARQAARLREQNETLQQAQIPLAATIQDLQHERDLATNQIAALRGDIERLNGNTTELLKLRGEVAVLQTQKRTADARQAENNRLPNHARAVPTQTAPDIAVQQRNECLNNLRQIDAAMQQFALENRLNATNVITADEILPYFKGNVMPVCPAGGTYTFGALNELPICSVPDHALPSSIESPAMEQVLGTVMSVVAQDFGGQIPANALPKARAAYRQAHNGQIPPGAGTADFILYLDPLGPRLQQALDAYKQVHNSQMPTNALELAPYLQPASPSNP